MPINSINKQPNSQSFGRLIWHSFGRLDRNNTISNAYYDSYLFRYTKRNKGRAKIQRKHLYFWQNKDACCLRYYKTQNYSSDWISWIRAELHTNARKISHQTKWQFYSDFCVSYCVYSLVQSVCVAYIKITLFGYWARLRWIGIIKMRRSEA